MSKMIQAIFTGILFTFILDFFFFLGIKLNYIDFYNIDLYYNILFADNQNIFLYALLSALFGFLIIYANNTITIIITLFASILTLSTLIAPIGHTLGEFVLMQKDTQLIDEKHIYRGDIYYNGRTQITFYDKKIGKMIVLEKNRLKEMN
jgi:hypothetical protein